MKKLIIFDCDGVLVDSEIIAFRHFIDLLKGKGYDLSEEEALQRFLGRSDKDAMEEITKESGIQFPDDFLTNMRQVIHDSMHNEVRATEGVAGVVAVFAGARYWAMCSFFEPYGSNLYFVTNSEYFFLFSKRTYF
jgi:beta-phosphoglucomutase-like phosphatase (HAD superfamily)